MSWAILRPIGRKNNISRILNNILLKLITQKYILSDNKPLCKNLPLYLLKLDHVEELYNLIELLSKEIIMYYRIKDANFDEPLVPTYFNTKMNK